MNNTKNKLELISSKLNVSEIKNTPDLFNKKIKKLEVRPLKLITSDTGKTRHFTPAAQE
jgi:hypothetical protein